MNVAIAVVFRDRFSMYRPCLEAVASCTQLPHRVIVVGGAVDTDTERYLRRLDASAEHVTVILRGQLLPQGEARKIALEAARERFLVILENDTIVQGNWLTTMLECMKEEQASVVTPLIMWYRGVHAAGCMFEDRGADAGGFSHTILYTDLRRKRIDYPETHCILIDRERLTGTDLFDDVEPFDVDFGLTLRRGGHRVFMEPRAVVTYSPAPLLEVRDIAPFAFRWDPESWKVRNRRFVKKWSLPYDPASKLASYRRQQMKLGVARWYPTRATVALSNVAFGLSNRLSSLLTRERRSYSSG